MSSEALQTLQISAITLACLSGLFGEHSASCYRTQILSFFFWSTGVYLVLVVLAIWATYRYATVSSKRLRWVTIALYVHAASLLMCLIHPHA